ncbi:MAG TPA: hypothetical protein VH851_16895 [Candidatus Binatia bacterium]
MIDLTQDIGNADVTIEFRGRRTEVVAVGYFLPVFLNSPEANRPRSFSVTSV